MPAFADTPSCPHKKLSEIRDIPRHPGPDRRECGDLVARAGRNPRVLPQNQRSAPRICRQARQRIHTAKTCFFNKFRHDPLLFPVRLCAPVPGLLRSGRLVFALKSEDQAETRQNHGRFATRYRPECGHKKTRGPDSSTMTRGCKRLCVRTTQSAGNENRRYCPPFRGTQTSARISRAGRTPILSSRPELDRSARKPSYSSLGYKGLSYSGVHVRNP